jgi:hypothetical protein
VGTPAWSEPPPPPSVCGASEHAAACTDAHHHRACSETAGAAVRGSRPSAGFRCRQTLFLFRAEHHLKGLEELDGDREDDGRVLLHGDFGQSLQVAQLDGGRFPADDLGGLGQFG